MQYPRTTTHPLVPAPDPGPPTDVVRPDDAGHGRTGHGPFAGPAGSSLTGPGGVRQMPANPSAVSGEHSAPLADPVGSRPRRNTPASLPHPRSPGDGAGRASGRSVLVVGATGKVGSAVARRLAAAGDRLVLHHGAGADRAQALLSSLPGSGHLTRAADLADPEQLHQLIADADDWLGGLDVVVNTAAARGTAARLDGPVQDWTERWSDLLSADLLGAASIAHAAADRFRSRGRGGRIVLVAGHRRDPDGPADLARESVTAAVVTLGAGLARALAPHGIDVTTVTAGPATATWWPESLAETIAWLVGGPGLASVGAVVRLNS